MEVSQHTLRSLFRSNLRSSDVWINFHGHRCRNTKYNFKNILARINFGVGSSPTLLPAAISVYQVEDGVRVDNHSFITFLLTLLDVQVIVVYLL